MSHKIRIAAALVIGLSLGACGESSNVSPDTGGSTASSTTVFSGVSKAIRINMSITDFAASPPRVSESVETASIDGSYRITSNDGSSDEAFDFASRTRSSRFGSTTPPTLNVLTNSPLGPPDETLRPTSALSQYVQSLRDEGNPSVIEVTFLDRRSYSAVFPVDISQGGYDKADVTIDAETGTVLRADTTLEKQPFMSWEAQSIDVNPDLTRFSFVINETKGDDVSRVDGGCVETQLSLVRAQIGYSPLLPTTLPSGYALARMTVKQAKGEPTGANGTNPQSENVASAMFKARGWQFMFVTTRSTAGAIGRWSDPIAQVEQEYNQAFETVTIQTGALSGATAESVVAPTGRPDVWAAGPSVVATVSGPFSRQSLKAAFHSLAER